MIDGNVLITGGSGTLGRALVRRALNEKWNCSFTVFSRSEYLQAEMRELYPNIRYVLGDVRDEASITAAIAGHDVVVHAAAMKRVPECEAQPHECYKTNVLGSANVLAAAAKHRVKTVVGISTDKACRAITVYGSSKLTMEQMFRNAAATSARTKYVLCRYGNVIASRGSVIELWRKQYQAGGQINVTSREATRFWITPGDAVNILVAASQLSNGETFVPVMKAISLGLLAEGMFPEAKIAEVGFRSVEKTHEDIIHEDEGCISFDGGFILEPSLPTGVHYTSYSSPQMTIEHFKAMLGAV